MDSLSKRVTSVTPSLTLSVTNQAKALRAAGEEVYALAGGEPDCDTPDFIKQALLYHNVNTFINPLVQGLSFHVKSYFQTPVPGC